MEKKAFSFEKNSFDVIRYFSAFSVMLLHYTYYAITVSGEKIPVLQLVRRITEFFPGVVILFSLSGFLIAASLERCSTKKEFFVKRIFRLYPELWICTMVNLVVILILAGNKLDGSIVIWFFTQIAGIANTPDCLKDFATGSINGALWTVFTEIQLYLLLGISYQGLKKLKKGGAIGLYLLAVLLNPACDYAAQNFGGVVAKGIERTFFPYLLWFLTGVYCYLWRNQILPVIKKYFPLLCVIFAANQFLNFCQIGYYEDMITSILLPFLTIGAAYLLPPKRLKYDVSYGIFLYQWIVINIMVASDMFLKLPWHLCLLLFMGTTFIVAGVSFLLNRQIYRGSFQTK